ncbi:hypothetical protein [Spirosoma gilvum]
METQKLSALQLDLLKIYSFQPSEEDILAVRKMLATYFSEKLTGEIQQAIDQQGITESDLDQWLNE